MADHVNSNAEMMAHDPEILQRISWSWFAALDMALEDRIHAAEADLHTSFIEKQRWVIMGGAP